MTGKVIPSICTTLRRRVIAASVAGLAASGGAGPKRRGEAAAGWRPVLLAVFALGSVLVAATPGSADVVNDRATLQEIRNLSGRYHSVAQAEAAGFEDDEICTAVPGLGGMGHHFLNSDRLDTTLEADNPEVLLFAPKPGGGLRLVGVEYVVGDADGRLDTDSDRPVLAGHAFDGPMPGHFPGMPVHYDLHVWAWTENPAGDFATWNTALTCP